MLQSIKHELKKSYSSLPNETKCKNKIKAKCCISPVRQDECVNKGGQCKTTCQEDEKPYLLPKGWKCSDKDQVCCVKNKDIWNYREYIQSYGGQGKIFIKPDTKFCAQGTDCADTYAIVYGAKTSHYAWFESPANINNIVIAPLDDISDICYAQAGTSGE